MCPIGGMPFPRCAACSNLGASFYFVEATSRALGRWVSRTFLEHPPPERWFSAEEFVSELERRNLVAQADFLDRRRDRFASLGLDLIGVGRVQPGPGPHEGPLNPHQASRRLGSQPLRRMRREQSRGSS